MPAATNGWRYLLVVKDDMCGYVRLYPGADATSQATASALLDWFGLIDVVATWVSMVQSALNHQPADRLGGVPPITVFLALPASTQLRALFHLRLMEQATVDWLAKSQQQQLQAVNSAHDRMHKDCLASAAAKRDRKRKQRENN
ncbi:hypothetical protein H310_12851 [Aphanomyces invadans]|uniref:Uncharacterized protein n=1 Tax=Aphanomyces invadans TaxID=157072 RepID=A0A024TFT4_9STRA|nr:hypothetical protein H310_12851 [Aphanomyces invadans]ETV93020.1 hypothetical protein H310_12851 [Aphanomyces invadans]|eukprot:XP_008878285.1 hypothetical protein H310_12851 [Aphanomyces invadans]